MREPSDGDYFTHCAASMRYSAPRTLDQALASCPPGWHAQIREIFHLVEKAKGRVWDCESKFARLDLGLEIPPDVASDVVEALNAHAAAAASTCEACGAPGRRRDARDWWRVLCDACDREVDAYGWRAVYARHGS